MLKIFIMIHIRTAIVVVYFAGQHYVYVSTNQSSDNFKLQSQLADTLHWAILCEKGNGIF